MRRHAPNQRPQRGLELARLKHSSFRRVADNLWLVPSATKNDSTYVVDVSRMTCSCPDFGDHGEMCKHLWATAYIANEITLIDGTRLSPPPVTKDEDSTPMTSAQGEA